MLPPRTSEWPICVCLCKMGDGQDFGDRVFLRTDLALAGYLERQRAYRTTSAEFDFKTASQAIGVLATILTRNWRFQFGKSVTGRHLPKPE